MGKRTKRKFKTTLVLLVVAMVMTFSVIEVVRSHNHDIGVFLAAIGMLFLAITLLRFRTLSKKPLLILGLLPLVLFVRSLTSAVMPIGGWSFEADELRSSLLGLTLLTALNWFFRILAQRDGLVLQKGSLSSWKWRRLRYEVLRKYGRKCMLCGSTAGSMHVDHIRPRSKYPELTFEINNLQVLCAACNIGKSNAYEDDFRNGHVGSISK